MQACNLSAQGPADNCAKQCVVGCAASQPGNLAPPVERTQKGWVDAPRYYGKVRLGKQRGCRGWARVRQDLSDPELCQPAMKMV